MIRLIKKSKHDIDNRDYAIMIINDKIYKGETHYNCVQDYNEFQYSKENNINAIDINNRRNLNIYYENVSYACGHVIEEYKSIFIEVNTLKNISIDEVIYLLQKQYPNYEFYDDDSFNSDAYCKFYKLEDDDFDESDIKFYTKIANKTIRRLIKKAK